jgi:hypothetical protein
MATTVTIKYDDEGMLGSASSDEIEKIDTERSYQEYERLFEEAIKQDYPDVKVEFAYGPYGGASIIVESDELDHNETDEMSDEIQEIGGRVYNDGAFWYDKK